MSKLNVTYLKAYEDGKIEMEAFYQSEPKSASRPFNYFGTLEELYISIQRGEIEILEEANQYKWTFILMTMVEEHKGQAINQMKMTSEFSMKARYIEEKPEKNYIIQGEGKKGKHIYLTKEQLQYKKYIFSDNINEAYQMNIHEATVKALRIIKHNAKSNIKLIQR